MAKKKNNDEKSKEQITQSQKHDNKSHESDKNDRNEGSIYEVRESDDGKKYSGERFMLRPESGMKGSSSILTAAEWKDQYGYDVYEDDNSLNQNFKNV